MLFIFKVCAETKSFSRASKILYVKQPSISYSVKKLEEILNVKLFDRGSFGIKLTNEGEILYDYVLSANNSILSGLKIIEENKKKEITELKLGVSLNISMSSLAKSIEEFRRIFPNTIISVFSKNEDLMLKELQEKRLDIVIFNTLKNYSLPDLTIKKIKNNDIVLVGNKRYKNTLANTDSCKSTKIPIILPNKDTYLGQKGLLDRKIDNVDFNNIIYCHSAVVGKELIKQGIGIGYINREIIKKELEEQKLYILNTEEGISSYSIDIATQSKNINIAIKQFIKIFKEKVEEDKCKL